MNPIVIDPSLPDDSLPVPYMGPSSFAAKDSPYFFGRDNESRELSGLIVAERIVLLYSPSGAGKTSLIQTRLPELLGDRFEFSPLIRLNKPASTSTNRYVESVLRSLGWKDGEVPTLASYCQSLVSKRQAQRERLFEWLAHTLKSAPESALQELSSLVWSGKGAAPPLAEHVKSLASSGLKKRTLTFFERLEGVLNLSPENIKEALVSMGFDGIGEQPRLGDFCKSLVELKPYLLIFDQFEEVLWRDPTDQAAKEAFFVQLRDLLRSPGDGEGLERPVHWALFSVREEFVGALEPYALRVSTQVRARFRLGLLSPEQAIEVIKKPASVVGVTISDALTDQIVRELRTVPVIRRGQPEATMMLPHIEPTYLQIVCLRMWKLVKPKRGETIDQDRIVAAEQNRNKNLKADAQEKELGAKRTHVEQALAEYYRDTIHEITRQPGVTVNERELREWIDLHLITPGGSRAHVEVQNAQEVQGLPMPLVLAMEKARLVRIEQRDERAWMELSHDRLVRPIKENNDYWYARHLNVWERLERTWRLLGKKEQQVFFATAMALLFVVVFVLLYALIDLLKSHATQQYLTQANDRAQDDPEGALVLVSLAGRSPEGTARLNRLLVRNSPRLLTVRQKDGENCGHNGPVRQVIRTDKWLVTLGTDAKLLRWDRDALARGGRVECPQPLDDGPEGPVNCAAYDETSQLLAVGSQDRSIRLWDMSKNPPQPKGSPLLDLAPNALVFFRPAHANKEMWLACVSNDGIVALTRVEPPATKGLVQKLNGHQGAVTCMAVDCPACARRLATAGNDARIVLWDLKAVISARHDISIGYNAVLKSVFKEAALDFNFVSQMIDGAGATNDERYALVLPGNRNAVTDVEFIHAGCDPQAKVGEEWLVSGGIRGELRLWRAQQETIKKVLADYRDKNVAYDQQDYKKQFSDQKKFKDLTTTATPLNQLLEGHTSSIVDLAISRKDNYLLTGGLNGEVTLWNLPRLKTSFNQKKPCSCDQPDLAYKLLTAKEVGFVTDIAFSNDEDYAAVGTTAGNVTVWQLQGFNSNQPGLEVARFSLGFRIHSLSFQSVFGEGTDALVCTADDFVRVWKLDRIKEDSRWEANRAKWSYSEMQARYKHLRAWKFAEFSHLSDKELATRINQD